MARRPEVPPEDVRRMKRAMEMHRANGRRGAVSEVAKMLGYTRQTVTKYTRDSYQQSQASDEDDED